MKKLLIAFLAPQLTGQETKQPLFGKTLKAVRWKDGTLLYRADDVFMKFNGYSKEEAAGLETAYFSAKNIELLLQAKTDPDLVLDMATAILP